MTLKQANFLFGWKFISFYKITANNDKWPFLRQSLTLTDDSYIRRKSGLQFEKQADVVDSVELVPSIDDDSDVLVAPLSVVSDLVSISPTCLQAALTHADALLTDQLLFHQQYYAWLYQNSQLEVIPNFYDPLNAPCASKMQ